MIFLLHRRDKMKFLHLADLHLGKILQEQSLIEDQEYMLKQIIGTIERENIETVLISGDVYDRSVPPAEAVNLLDSFLRTLIKELKIKVFIIAGNHDSKDRLAFGSKIFEDEGLYIESKYNGNLRKVEVQDEYGKLNIYMLPFVKPIEVKQFFKEDLENNYNTAINKICTTRPLPALVSSNSIGLSSKIPGSLIRSLY